MNTNLLRNWQHDWFGVWREGDYFPVCPLVEDFVCDSPLPDTDRLLDFLKSAPVVAVFGTKCKCFLCDDYLPVGIRSDGVITWPLDLPHYVEKHGVILPDRFFDRIRRLNYAAPTACDKTREELPWPRAVQK